jgi:hypothetical protein
VPSSEQGPVGRSRSRRGGTGPQRRITRSEDDPRAASRLHAGLPWVRPRPRRAL